MAHYSLRTSRKLHTFSRALRLQRPAAVGHLTYLWWTADDHRSIGEDGVLSGWTPQDIADAALWKGKADAFVKALVSAGFLDVVVGGANPDGPSLLPDDLPRLYAIHDYKDWASDFVRKRWKREKVTGSLSGQCPDKSGLVRPIPKPSYTIPNPPYPPTGVGMGSDVWVEAVGGRVGAALGNGGGPGVLAEVRRLAARPDRAALADELVVLAGDKARDPDVRDAAAVWVVAVRKRWP